MTNRIVDNLTASHTLRPLAAAVGSCVKLTRRNAASATALAMFLAAPGLAHATTYQVTNTKDSGPGSLRQAVKQANAHSGADVIVFASTVSGTIKLTSGPLELLDSVSVKGPGATKLAIDAGDASEIFLVSDDTSVNLFALNVSGLTLANATTAISAELGGVDLKVNVENTTITGCTKSAIRTFSYFGDGRLTVSNSSLTANDDAAIRVVGTYGTGGTVLDNVTISNNKGTGIVNESSSVKITGSEIKNNAVGLLGDAAFSYSGAYFNISDSVITQNKGDGIRIGHASVLDLSNSTVKGNGGDGIDTGDIYHRLTIRNSTLSNNADHGINDSGRYSELTIGNSTISGNRSGFGVNQEGYGAEVSISNSTITNNALGGVYSSDLVYKFAITNGIVANNASSGGADLSGKFTVHHSLIKKKGSATLVVPVAGSNIFNQDPLLGPLQDNGGPTSTQAPLNGSPVIDTGANGACPKLDQRGIARPQDGNADGKATCDMGAFERIAKSAKASLAVKDVVVSESVGTAKVKVILTAPSTQTVKVQYATQPGTALQGSDYSFRSGTLTYKPGETSKIISVPIIDDKKKEPNENFKIKLTNPVNAVIADSVGVVTIKAND